MALGIREEYYENFLKREPEQDFYDCWKRIASEIKKKEKNRVKNNRIEISRVEEYEESDDLRAYSAKYTHLRDEWNEFNR